MALTAKTKEKIDHLQKRARVLGAQAAKGGKMTLVEAAVGAGSYYALGALQEKIEFLQSHWYVTPGVLIAAGHFLKRKSVQLGAGLVFLGGFLGAQGYDQESSDEGDTSTKKEGSGYDDRAGDAGAWGMLDGGEAGSLQGADLVANVTRNALGMGQPNPAMAGAGEMLATEAFGLSD